MRRRIALATLLIACACSSAAGDRDDTPPDIHFDRIAATPELAALGVTSYRLVDDDAGVQLFDGHGRLVASVHVEVDDGVFAEAIVADRSYAMEGEPSAPSFALDGDAVVLAQLTEADRTRFRRVAAAAGLVAG